MISRYHRNAQIYLCQILLIDLFSGNSKFRMNFAIVRTVQKANFIINIVECSIHQRCVNCGCVSPRIQIRKIFWDTNGLESCSVTKFVNTGLCGSCFATSVFFPNKI